MSGFTQTTSTFNFTLTPFAKYYLDNGLFFQASAGFGVAITSVNSGGLTSSGSSAFGISTPSVGYAFFVNEKTSLEIALSVPIQSGIPGIRIPIGAGFRLFY